jgi:hypothetical protein
MTRSRGCLTGGAAGVILASAVACSAPAATLAVTAAKPQTCAQQYQAWKNGPANAPGKRLEADEAALRQAGNSDDIPAMTSGLSAVAADATALQAYPVPACADPAGYWAQYLADIRAAGDNAATSSGLAALILAEAPLKNLPAIQAKLSAELAKTAGVKAPAAAAAQSTAAALPTLATVAPVTVPSPSPLPSLQPVATAGT